MFYRRKDVYKKQRKEEGLILQSGTYIFFVTIILKGTAFFFRVLQTNETLTSKSQGERGVLSIMDYMGRLRPKGVPFSDFSC